MFACFQPSAPPRAGLPRRGLAARVVRKTQCNIAALGGTCLPSAHLHPSTPPIALLSPHPALRFQQAEEAALRPARARIVLHERRRRGGGKHSDFYEVLFERHPREEGTW